MKNEKFKIKTFYSSQNTRPSNIGERDNSPEQEYHYCNGFVGLFISIFT